MHKLIKEIKDELKCIEEQGLSSTNLDVLSKLTDIEKDLLELEEKEQEDEYMRYGRYYNGRNYGRMYREDNYGRGGYERSGQYGHYDERLYDRLDRIAEAMDTYLYGRDRYRDNGSQERLEEGLEKVMYSICTLVESIVDFAETPEEKEIVRKHIDKIHNI